MPEGDTLAPINLALQGGGSHGALTWGVLDALLEDGRLLIDGISGTSAGAMNAVVVAHGFAQAAQQHKDPKEAHAAGCELARAGLTRLWEGVGTLGSLMWGTPLAAATTRAISSGVSTGWVRCSFSARMRAAAQASSTRSMALSGRQRPGRYRTESSTAACKVWGGRRTLWYRS